MGTAEVVEQLKQMSNAERLTIIEAATRLVREEIVARSDRVEEEDPILRVAGCLDFPPLSAEEIEEELYGRDGP